jgi:hypothetical protein
VSNLRCGPKKIIKKSYSRRHVRESFLPVKYLTTFSLSHFLFIYYLFVLVSLLPVVLVFLTPMTLIFVSFLSLLLIHGGGQDDAVRCWGSRGRGYGELLEVPLQ